ncbi:hypothetical protein HKX48_004946 [Thoreauomyces humboldtii]|nr:hypothetical protein HKX48_004946 [Thoreauomyces humboldtii]
MRNAARWALLLSSLPTLVIADDGVNFGGSVGVLPKALVAVIVVLVVLLCAAFAYLFWRRHHGSGPDPEAPVARQQSRFRESGNWKKRFSRVMKEEEQQQSEIFRAGTILATLSSQHQNGEGRGVSRKGSGRKPGEPLVTLSSSERPALARTQSRGGPSREPHLDVAVAPAAERSHNAASDRLADLSRKPTNRSTKSTTRSRKDQHSVHSVDSAGTGNDEHDLLAAFRATGRGDLGLGSGFSNQPISSVIKIETDYSKAAGSDAVDHNALHPTMRSARSNHSSDLPSVDDSSALHPNHAITRSGTVKSGVDRKKSLTRSGSQRRGNSPPPSPRNSYQLSQIDTDHSRAGGYIPSPPAYTAHTASRGPEEGSDRVSRHGSRRRPSSRSPTRAPPVERSRSTRTSNRTEDDRDDLTRGRSERDRERGSKRTANASRSRTREAPTSHSTSASRIKDDDDADLPLGVAIARARSTRDAASSGVNSHRTPSSSASPLAPSSSVRRNGTSRSSRKPNDSTTGVSRSGSTAAAASRRSTRRREEDNSDDEMPLASVALSALQMNMAPEATAVRPPRSASRKREPRDGGNK